MLDQFFIMLYFSALKVLTILLFLLYPLQCLRTRGDISMEFIAFWYRRRHFALQTRLKIKNKFNIDKRINHLINTSIVPYYIKVFDRLYIFVSQCSSHTMPEPQRQNVQSVWALVVVSDGSRWCGGHADHVANLIEKLSLTSTEEINEGLAKMLTKLT